MKAHFTSMTLGLAVGVAGAVLLASAGAAWLYSRHHLNSLLASAENNALAQGNLIRVALEHQMIENDRTLIQQMIDNFRKEDRVGRLTLLDRYGKEHYPAATPVDPNEFNINSSTCQACHRYPPEQRGSSRVVETVNGTLLRTVIPIHNREACYRCHDPNHKINGILILDSRTDEIRAEMNHDLGWLVAGSVGITLLLVGAIGALFRFSVLKRLQRFETVSRKIAGGDLGQRVPIEGADTLSWMAREFNTMADSVTGLVGEVRTQRERLETIINSIDDGIVVLDSHRNVLAANDAFLRRVNQSRDKLIGCSCTNLMPGACNPENCPTLSCLASGQRQVRITERVTDEGGSAWEEIHASPVRDASGHASQVVEVWRDISERRAAEAHLAESHRLASVGTLASGFSHELNTPLATVLMCIEGIMREFAAPGDTPLDPQHIHDNASIAREQVLRCRGITQHFLRLARGQRTQGDIVDVGSVVATASSLVAPTARVHSVTVETTADCSALVRADEAELQHTVINLMLNAIQACPAGGKVQVTVSATDAVRIRVTDTGCGISPENRKRIFEPFFSMRQGGTGLGLFLSLNFVRRWSGDIAVESTLGHGSTFEVTLPFVSNPAAAILPREAVHS
jgi:PAS domain S-box-containing protein